MKKNEHLFFLIKSLTKSEKRYFKLNAGANKIYVKLFDAILAQETYDEDAIRKEFAGEAFLKQLHVTKNYLNKLILQSLKAFHQKVSKSTEVLERLRNIEILFHKELYEQCLVEIDNTQKLAERFELYTSLLNIIQWKKAIIQRKTPNRYDILDKFNKQYLEVLKLLENQNHFQQMGIDLAQNVFRAKKNELKLDGEAALTIDAKVSYLNAVYLQKLQERDFIGAKKTLQELALFLEHKPDILIEKAGLYISSVNNLIGFLIYQNEMQEALDWIRKTKIFYEKWRHKKKSKSLLKQIFRVYNSELEIYRFSENPRSYQREIDVIKGFVFANENKAPEGYLASFWFQFANLHFDKKEYLEALTWVNKFLNTTSKNIRKDLHIQIRFLNLMIHLERQNLFVLRYFTENTKRYIRQNRALHTYEKTLLKFFQRIGKSPKASQKELFRKLRNDIQSEFNLSNNPQSKMDLQVYLKWLEGKEI